MNKPMLCTQIQAAQARENVKGQRAEVKEKNGRGREWEGGRKRKKPSDIRGAKFIHYSMVIIDFIFSEIDSG